MKKLVSVLAASVCLAAVADVTTNVWIKVDGSGNWSDAANWENGEKPAADGSSFVIISNDLTSSAVNYTITVDEDASVRGIRYLQSGKANTKPTLSVSTGKTLTIGKDGIYGQQNGAFNSTDSTKGRQMDIKGHVVLADTQIWQDHINGVGHGDWVSTFSGDLTAAASVNWVLTGMKHTISSGIPRISTPRPIRCVASA